ncbi:hypothetical protein ACVOMT_22915 (plasmid) [Sphingomonas panni]|uniref:hypothetical protein n=1 Tax=Sphingomonas hankookensis TaxID=563996 RepID=UPI003D303BC9
MTVAMPWERALAEDQFETGLGAGDEPIAALMLAAVSLIASMASLSGIDSPA